MLEICGLKKGYYIWKVWTIEEGDPVAIRKIIVDAGLSHVLIKIANGVYAYNKTPKEYVTPLVEELHKYNIIVLGWHYVYGDCPIDEANIAIRRIQETGVDGYVIDAETEYKNKKNSAIAFMAKMRLEFPELFIALSSFRYPKVHPEIPWKEFLSKCNCNMPQVYWEQAHNSAWQLGECVTQFEALYKQLKINYVPIVPTGSTYKCNSWQPTDQDVYLFLSKAYALELDGCNFWELWHGIVRNPQLFEVVKKFEWKSDVVPPLTLENRIVRLEKAVFGK